MRTRKKHKAVQGIGLTTVVANMRRTLGQHCQKNIGSYAPALAPVVLFLLAHVLVLLVLVLMKTGVMASDQEICKTMVTWAVYGLLPFLLCSYGAFHLVARRAATVLEDKFPHWSAGERTLAGGAVYGVALILALVLLLRPESGLNILLLCLIGAVAGLGNWFFYRKFARTDE